jgi:hypothetical protein
MRSTTVSRRLTGSPTILSLENPYVYDSVARELKQLAHEGLVELVAEEMRSDLSDPLIGAITFKRVR